MHAAFREAEDQAGRRVRVDDSTNFRAAPRPRLVLPVEKPHGAPRKMAVAAAVIGLQVVRRRERRDVAESYIREGPYFLKVRRAGGFKQYEAQVKKSLAATLVPKFPQIPAEVIPTIVEFWAHAGDY